MGTDDPPEIVSVTWLDHAKGDGYVCHMEFFTVGFLVGETDECYQVAPTVHADRTCPHELNLETTAILKCAVVSIDYWELG